MNGKGPPSFKFDRSKLAILLCAAALLIWFRMLCPWWTRPYVCDEPTIDCEFVDFHWTVRGRR